MNQIVANPGLQTPEKSLPLAQLFEPHAISEGSVLLESSLSAYGRGQMSFVAHSPIDKFEIPQSDSLPENWPILLDKFIGDRSQFCALFLSYDFGAEICAGIQPSNQMSGLPRIVAYKYDSVKQSVKQSVTQIETEDLFNESGQTLTPSDITRFSRPDPERYTHDVRKIKERIKEGDIYQANLTGQWEVTSDIPPWDVYQNLRRLNPAQYAGFANLGETTIISSSPERLLSVSGQTIRANPIKGTIELGESEAETLRNKERLLASAKDRAELLMIVDLLRNDLGKVCRYGTVVTHDIWKPEVYSSLIHLVGSIQGELRADVSVSEIIMALYPGGSISGAPKKRAIEILADIERRPRGIYTGSIGYVYRDQMDLNIAIRTMTHTHGTYTIQAGGGIVADRPGNLTHSSLRAAKRSGNLTHSSLQAAKRSGNLTHSSLRAAKRSGNLTHSSLRAAKRSGNLTHSSLRAAKRRGNLTHLSLRGAKRRGNLTHLSLRGAKRRGNLICKDRNSTLSANAIRKGGGRAHD